MNKVEYEVVNGGLQVCLHLNSNHEQLQNQLTINIDYVYGIYVAKYV